MDARDRAYLHDVVQFIHMNHLSAAYLLRAMLGKREEGLEEVARFAMGVLRKYESPDVLAATVRQNNDAVRVQKVLVARLYAEMISAYEDLGAFGWAILNRAKGGIFQRAATSNPGEPGQFFDHVLALGDPAISGPTLDKQLKLKALDKLSGSVPAEMMGMLEVSYQSTAANVYRAAKTYREEGRQIAELGQGGGGENGILPGWEDDLNIILDVIQPGEQARGGAVYVRAFQKIKHGFTVTENLPAYDDPAATTKIEYARLKTVPDEVDPIFHSTCLAAATMAEIAAILIGLDEAGVRL